MRKIEIQRDVLYKMYIEDKLSKTEISKRLNISMSTLQNLLKEHDISRDGDMRRRFIDKDTLVELLVDQKKGKYEVCDILKIDYHTLSKNIKFYNIDIPKKEYDVNKIRHLYNVEHKTMSEISKIIEGCSYSTINRILHANNIEIRESRDYERNQKSFPSNKQNVSDGDIDKLKDMYYNCCPVGKIAEELHVSRGAVDRKVKELNLERKHSMYSREQYDDSNDEIIIKLYNEGKSTTEIAKIIGVTHRTVQQHIVHSGYKLRTYSESQFKKNSKEFPEDLSSYDSLYDLYVTQRLSKKELSSMYNVSPNVIDRLLKKYNIHKRGQSEALKGVMVGPNHPNWKGGRTGLYMRLREYFFVNQQKQTLERDHYTCQYPGCGSKKKLHVHHIVPFKEIFDQILSENPELDIKKDEEKIYEIMTHDPRMNNMGNLITYCKECHLFKVHGYEKGSKEIALF